MNLLLYIAEAGPPVAPSANSYQSQLEFADLGSQEPAGIGGGVAAVRGGRFGLGCDAFAADFLLDPSDAEAITYCSAILEMVRAAGYVILWVDFGKYVAYRFGGTYHARQNELRRIRYRRAAGPCRSASGTGRAASARASPSPAAGRTTATTCSSR